MQAGLAVRRVEPGDLHCSPSRLARRGRHMLATGACSVPSNRPLTVMATVRSAT